MGFEPRREGVRQDVQDFVSGMERASEEAQAALERAASDMARFYDAHRDVKLELEVGDQVWLDSRNIRTTRPVKKLDDKWFGPFPITHKYSRNAYRLRLPSSMRIHPVFHVSLLRRFVPDPISTRPPPEHPPPLVMPDGTEEYEAEEILESRRVPVGRPVSMTSCATIVLPTRKKTARAKVISCIVHTRLNQVNWM